MQAEKTEVIDDRRRTSLSLVALGILAPLGTLAAGRARAAGFPARPVTLVVPFAAGGATDTLVRTLADGASKHLGQPVVVENRPGAAGVLGANYVARAKPDGYTLTIMPEPVFRLPHLQKTQFDPMQDFTYVIHLTGYSLGVATRADAPWKSWQDMVEEARRNPGKISYGTTGTNSTMHVTMEEISQRLGIRLNHVPYKGESEIIAAMMGGHIDLGVTAGGIGPYVDSGKARWLVLWTAGHSRRWPSVPTLRDVGLDMVSTSPFGIAGPRGMDAQAVQVLHEAFRKALYEPAMQLMLDKLDQEMAYLDSSGYAAFARQRYESQGKLVKRLGLSANP
ncbi:tripartite tricarboxylate transporter substrate binding protein [Cupriavidus pinatubonensis]|uniref:tripartite tricarboxylate transporter substrate binding protein n=1 Tax=Cupriavidus pinatubonensis TaxID=248026 RepID=UPI001128E9B5|nr:tripartite tricarboxylate transporter substrate binding protein [Cupriavidus pinatubonensis]TPQ40212.1 tripartite tricarboxylate transporter substrate binding protein [Cupriavidus pinatubonensis]